MDLLLYVVCFSFGWYLSSIFFSWQLRRAILKVAKEEGLDLVKEKGTDLKKVPVLTTESIDDTIFLYDVQNNFICQAKTLDELADNLLKYKKMKLAIIVHENRKFFFVEGKLEKA